jgi:pimeloyl-ACP methyl ester carboxylesterase
MTTDSLIFLHGLEGSSQGVKATLLRGIFPGILTPDFHGDLNNRMQQLDAILEYRNGWRMIGSSFGGLMAALFACRHPERVDRLILLAPALIWPDFAMQPPEQIDLPVVVIHGRHDTIVPLEATRPLAERVFTNLSFQVVDDDHGLYKTVHELDWLSLLESQDPQGP